MDGSDEERRLCRWFADDGWCVMKSPSSGSATAREQPDVLAGHPTGPAYAIELKTRSDTRAYVEASEVEDLKVVAAAFDADLRLVARWSQDKSFYAYHPDDLQRTDGGAYVLRKDERDAGEEFPPAIDG